MLQSIGLIRWEGSQWPVSEEKCCFHNFFFHIHGGNFWKLTACKLDASPVSLDDNTPTAWSSWSNHPHSWRINAANAMDLFMRNICNKVECFEGKIYIYRSLRTKFEPVLAYECDCMMAATNKIMPIARKEIHNSIVRACASASSFIANACKKIKLRNHHNLSY